MDILLKAANEELLQLKSHLADAQHQIILLGNNMAAFQRVAEQRQQKIDELELLVYRWMMHENDAECDDRPYDDSWKCIGLPERMPHFKAKWLALHPTTGASNG